MTNGRAPRNVTVVSRYIVAIFAMFFMVLATVPAQAQQQRMLSAALVAAGQTFAAALPQLGGATMGVPTSQYRDALTRQLFRSSRLGGDATVKFPLAGREDARCARFVAYVNSDAANIHLCPKFFSPGADDLRTLTVLHEMVHVVAGPDECLAMAYTAKIQMLATGSFVPVDVYWAANKCDRSGYRLPN